MKLYTDLDIVNGLSTCRDMFEAKAYLKANNIAISDQELEVLQSQCNKINSERTLTIRQLNNVAGGMFGMEAHRQEAPQYGGETTFGAETHRTRAVRSNLAQFRVDPNSAVCRKMDAMTAITGLYLLEHNTMEEIMESALNPRSARRSVRISPDEAIKAAKAIDAEHQVFKKENAQLRQENTQLRDENADLAARIEYYVRRYGGIPDLSEVIPSSPPDSRHNSPPNSP